MKFALQIRPGRFFEPGGSGVVQRLLLRPQIGLLELTFGSFRQTVYQFPKGLFGVETHVFRQVATHGTVVFLLVLERVSVDARVAGVEHVVSAVGLVFGGRVGEEGGGLGDDFEGFVAARGGDDGIGGGDGGDDVLHDPLRHGVGDAGDVELGGAGGGGAVQPGDVFRVVGVERDALALFFPLDDVRPFYTVLWLAGDGGEGA